MTRHDMGAAYYNDNEPYVCAWLRNLIAAGLIAPGDVDERSIKDVKPDDLRGYTQAHFFAGIGGWSYALRLAGWPADRPIWTGSCPCQPFSAAGAGKAADDGRHLWPAWFSLIAECRPAIVLGEQVEAAIGWGWFDAVFANLEGEGYACGATVLPACGVGAPHIRQRLWFVGVDNTYGDGRRAWRDHNGKHERIIIDANVGARELADANGGDASTEGLQRSWQYGQRTQDGGASFMADAESGGCGEQRHETQPQRGGHDDGGGIAGELAISKGEQFDGRGDARPGRRQPSNGRGMVDAQSEQARLPGRARQSRNAHWSDLEFLPCTDGKARPTQPGLFPLAHGVRRRTSKLRAYGNAIVPQLAAEFIGAFMELRP